MKDILVCGTRYMVFLFLGVMIAQASAIAQNDQPTSAGSTAATAPPPSQPARVVPYRPERTEDQVREFENAYHEANRPVIAVVLNGSASTSVAEWRSKIRTALDLAVQNESQQKETDATETVSSEDEVWVVQFEESFMKTLRGSGVQVVDRDTVSGALSKKGGDAGPKTGTKRQVEPQTLSGKANILAEILVSQEPNQKSGYVFRAKAVKTKSGDVIVTVTSTFLGSGLPGPEDVARFLAEDLMSALQPKLK